MLCSGRMTLIVLAGLAVFPTWLVVRNHVPVEAPKEGSVEAMEASSRSDAK